MILSRKFLLVLFLLIDISGYAQSVTITTDTVPAGLLTNVTTRTRTDFLVEPDGSYWVSYYKNGILHKDNSGWQLYKATTSGLISDTVYCLAKDSTGRLWAGTDQGISIFDGASWTQLNTSNGLPNDTISCIAHSLSDTWIGTKQGLAHYNSNWTYYNTSNSPLPVDSITALEIDSTGLWIGTDSGLVHYDGNAWTLYNPSNSNLTSWKVRGITSGPQALFIGTADQGYFALRNGQFIRIDSFIGGDVITNPPGSSMYDYQESMRRPLKDADGNIYFIWGGGVVYNYPQVNFIRADADFKFSQVQIRSLRSNNMNLMQIDSAGHFYFCVAGLPLTSAAILDPNVSIIASPLNWNSLKYIKGLSDDYISVNNVTALINNNGHMYNNPWSHGNFYQVPDSVSTLFGSALWIGGFDQNNNLHVAANTYLSNGASDFFAGPLDTINGTADSSTSALYDRLWNINRDTLNDFIANYNSGNVANGTYSIPEVILNWPAHGTGNISRNLAPFIDSNGDAIYNPADGDYPDMRGDQMLWWIFNDTLAPHGESSGAAFGLEIHASAWAYHCPNPDSVTEVLNNSTFYKYEIYNRSTNIYDSVYTGVWVDPDMGNAADDYVGCDTLLNTGFVFNGDNDDEGSDGYGLNPPMQNITIMKGTEAYPGNNYDDDHNGYTDEPGEKNGLSGYVYYIGLGNVPNGRPGYTDDYYQYLTSTWLDGHHFTYGETGRNLANPQTNYMFSGTPYDTAGWTMASANVQPDDMRMILSSGPFHLGPGEMQSIEYACIFTRDTTGPNGLNTSIRKNKSDVSKILSWYNNQSFPCLSTSVSELQYKPSVNVYPNPSNNIVYLPSGFSKATVQLFDVNGKLLADEKYTDAGVSIAHFARQLIIFRINLNGNVSYARVIKM